MRQRRTIKANTYAYRPTERIEVRWKVSDKYKTGSHLHDSEPMISGDLAQRRCI